MVREFREQNGTTPIVLMGYYNPIYCYGVERFLSDAAQAGVDGLIVVDLPLNTTKSCASPPPSTASISSAWLRPPPMPSACPKCWPTLPGSSTTLPWR